MDETLTDCDEAEEEHACGYCEQCEMSKRTIQALCNLRHMLGPTFLRRMLDGISRMI